MDERPLAVRASLERMWTHGGAVCEDVSAPWIRGKLSPPDGTPRARFFHTQAGFSTESMPFSTMALVGTLAV